jgi:hypothetical protein
MTPEDSRYNMEIVEDETMLLCLDLNGKGLANGEIAGGLLQVMSYFARGVENKDVRETMADVLESFANHLRTKAPQQLDLELRRKISADRLLDKAVQEGREPPDSSP